jgi:hypothetical protein
MTGSILLFQSGKCRKLLTLDQIISMDRVASLQGQIIRRETVCQQAEDDSAFDNVSPSEYRYDAFCNLDNGIEMAVERADGLDR